MFTCSFQKLLGLSDTEVELNVGLSIPCAFTKRTYPVGLLSVAALWVKKQERALCVQTGKEQNLSVLELLIQYNTVFLYIDFFFNKQ